MSEMQTALSTLDREVTSMRIFNAPRELVWQAWVEPQHVAQWWGPIGFTNTIHEMEVRPGGVWRLTMHGPDGVDYPNYIVFREVVRPERLVYTHGAQSVDDPHKFEVTVLFEALGKRTLLTLQAVFTSKAIRNEIAEKYGAVEGMHQTLERLAVILESIATS